MTTDVRRLVAIGAVGALLGTGCYGTTYQPREPGRIHFVMKFDGKDVLEKDGKKYTLDETGLPDGLADEFAGNAAAQEHIRSYADSRRTARGWATAGVVGLGVGIFLLALMATPPDHSIAPDQADSYNAFRRGQAIATGVTWLASFAAFAFAGKALESGEPHLYDAINIYNDAAGERAR